MAEFSAEDVWGESDGGGAYYQLSTWSAARLVDWWHEGRPGGSQVRVVSQFGSASLLEEVHEQIPESVIVDATGADADDVFRRMLTSIGVPDSELTPHRWHRAAKRLAKDRLVLVTNAWRAGSTRRSTQPSGVLNTAAGRLALRGAGVIVDAGPRGRAPVERRRGVVTLGLDDSAVGDQRSRLESQIATAMNSPHLQVLALSEPRRVPLPVWSQLAQAAGIPDSDEDSLRRLAERLSDLVTIIGHQVVLFIDESVPEVLRRRTPETLSTQVHRHMARWLRETHPQFHHPEGWATSGPVGRYAAQGLAMHAVQAGEFEELLDNGSVLANLPQTELLDAAHCAYDGSLFGSNAAADAVFLRMYGVAPSSQAQWAAWLHLTATARDDAELCRGIENSGVHLPWKALWTRWRPPGGYDPRYLRPGPVYELFSVRWRGRPAVAGCSVDDTVHIWDVSTPEVAAGPWSGEEFPVEQLDDLAWDADRTQIQEDGPRSLRELRTQELAAEGPGEDDEFLPVALVFGDTTVLAGVGGVCAVASTSPGTFAEIAPLGGKPLLGTRTAAGPAKPKHAPETTASDLGELVPDAPALRTRVEHIPPGLTEETARRVLADIGLPAMREQGIELQSGDTRFLEELPWPGDVEPSEETGPFFRVGLWMGGVVVIDGPTGHVLRVPHGVDESGLDGALLAKDLDRFLRMLVHWITGLRILEDLDNQDEANLLRQHIDDALWDIDDEGAAAGAWKYALHNE
ncbi:SUKH-4 family immunity protein [Streptomyces sp. NPDC004129]